MHIFAKGKPEETEEKNESTPAIPSELPILPLRGTVVYPLTVLPLTVEQARSIQLVDDAALGSRVIGLLTIREDREGVVSRLSVRRDAGRRARSVAGTRRARPAARRDALAGSR